MLETAPPRMLKSWAAAEVAALQSRRSHLVKVGNNFVEKPEALDSLVVHLGLGVEVGEARDGCKHHAHGVVGLGVQLLWGQTSQTEHSLSHFSR